MSYDSHLMCNYVSCLAQLPMTHDSSGENLFHHTGEITIANVIGGPTSDPWSKLPVSVKEVATATKNDKAYRKLL